MEITEIRIKLMEGSEDRLRGFCSITIENAFVIRDLKIIDGSNGPFVAMPSRKLSSNCQRCRHKNHLRSNYCNHCGTKLQNEDAGYATPQKLYADVAHPINSECREEIQQAVLTELEAELARCEQPGYRSRYDDDFDTDEAEATARTEPERRSKDAAEESADTNSQHETSEPTPTKLSETTNATQLSDRTATIPATESNPDSSSSDSEQQTTKRIDRPPTDAIPAPLSPRNPDTAERKPSAMPQADGNDDFGAGVF